MSENLNPKEKKKSESKDSALFYLEHGAHLESRTIHLIGDVEEMDAFWRFDALMTALEAESRKTITIRIYTFGGSMYDSFAIIGRIKRSPCKVVTEGYGAVMSAGVLIIGAGSHRRLSRYAIVMHHSASYAIEGKHEHISEYVRQAEAEEVLRSKWLAEFSKLSEEQWRSKAKKTDWYMTAEQALEAGLVDELF